MVFLKFKSIKIEIKTIPDRIIMDFECKRCAKSFRDQFNLDRHLNQKKQCKCYCKICDLKITTYSHLQRHLKTKSHLAKYNQEKNLQNNILITNQVNNQITQPQVDDQIIETHNMLIDNFKGKPVLYCSLIIASSGIASSGIAPSGIASSSSQEVLFKFGHSNDIANRYNGHRSEFGNNNIFFRHVYECNDNVKAERLLKQHPLIEKNVVTRKINNQDHRELIQITNDLTEYALDQIMKEVTTIINSNPSNEIDLELEKEKTKQKEIEEITKQEIEKTKQMQIQLEMLKFRSGFEP
jgi:hypothetical protein